MKKQIILIIGILLLTSFVSAIDLQAGETYEIDLGLPYSHYEIVANSTEVDIDVTLNGTIASITPSKYMKSGSFDIVFYTGEKEIIVEVPASCPSCGGGGTRTVYEDKIINRDRLIEVCSDETECIDEIDITKDELDVKIEEVIKTKGVLKLVLFVGLIATFCCFIIYSYIKKRKDNENRVS